MSKTIFITGASTGIGKLTAIHFAKQGWNVAATMRDPQKGNDLLIHKSIKVVTCDVMDQNSIKNAIDSTLETFGNIDVILNNAGYALVGAFETMSDVQIKKQFDTNVYGTMNVTRAILPYFRKKKAGTIITTTSMGGLITFPLYSVYHATKWALEGFMESLQYELRPFNIKVKNIEPGAIKTEFENAQQFVSNDEYEFYTSVTFKNMLDQYKNAPNAEVVAKKIWLAANDSSFRLRYPVGGGGPFFLFLRWLLPHSVFRFLVAMQLEKGIKR